ncbi:pathogenicity island protein [Staphylococcus nepalensis]|uniref:type II toxin-antitoxin system antitoxin TscA n=1 Tax=Staphylococcus nepalensis TaxID=214473 RepID=UPI0035118852
MTQEQKELLTYIHYILEMNIKDKSETFEHTVEEDGVVEKFEIDREKHLEEVMRWATQEIEKHFEITINEKEETE